MTNSMQKKARAWQRMLSGRRLDLLDPSPVDIEIEDIAHGLSFVARWNGQTVGEYPYSVAEHSLLVEKIFSIPGIGRDFVDSALNRDYTLVMGVVLFVALLITLMNLVVDIAYAYLDPRVSYD